MNTGDLVRCFYEEIWNCGNQAKIPELLHESFTFRGSLGQTKRGRDGFAEYVEFVRDALSEYPKAQSHHYAFHVGDAEFRAILDKVKAKGLLFGSEPSNRTDGQLYSGRGRRGFYFEDPNGHLLEVMTVPETRS
jgi:catechol 2,3-dioxygenase-like lactoylglutathione lyase family enzyme